MCSLKEAFETQGYEDPGFAPLYSTNTEAPVAERKKKRRRRLLPPPEPALVDPDRPANRPPEPVADFIEEKARLTEPFDASLLTAPTEDDSSYFPHPSSDVDNATVYRLEPDWAKVFDVSTPQWIKDRIPPANVASPLTPSPWTDGAATLWQSVPGTLRKDVGPGPGAQESRYDDLARRLDRLDGLFADLEMSRTQSNHLELIMFVLAGLFLILLLDLLVKQGTAATLALAGVNGGVVGLFGGR